MINKTIGACRFVYNLALETKIRAYQDCGVNLTCFELQRQLTNLKIDLNWLSEVDSQSLKESINNVDKAFKNFFSGKGYPNYKRKRASGSFQCPGNLRKIDWLGSTISIPKIYHIPILLSRRFDGQIKVVTIIRTATNKYFASVIIETNQETILPQIPNQAIGIDLGISTFATLSTGQKINNPRHLRSELKRLKVLQKRASRKQKGSNNRNKSNLKVALLHEKITNQRKDFLQKLSTKLISDNQTDTICLESLPVKNMVRNHKLAQAISDVSWAEFVRQLEYKGKWYGKNIIKIDRFYASSKICSDCGHIKDELNLSERTWGCSNCGAIHDRDINAAINIRNSGMGSPGEPVELPAIVGAMKQESMSIHTLLK